MILLGHVLDRLKELPDNSVQCVVTSPPYWGLRAYGTEPQIWGGDPDCNHAWETAIQPAANGIIHAGGMTGETLSTSSATRRPKLSDTCSKCAAWRGELGLEPAPALFVAHMVEVFREVRRVLKPDGTCWVNMGDSYCSTAPGTMGDKINQRGIMAGVSDRRAEASRKPRFNTPEGLKPKDLVGIPWRLAFALQDAGWYLRSDIIWSKPNPMPESVTDRPTKAHEYIFLLTKSAKYFYNADAIKEAATGNAHARGNGVNPKAKMPGANSRVHVTHTGAKPQSRQNESFSAAVCGLVDERNARTVWTIGTQPYAEAHFATFPEELPRRCIMAGSREGDTVLDPFLGSGTTAAVAVRLGRQYIGIELNEDYAELAKKRIAAETPSLFKETAA